MKLSDGGLSGEGGPVSDCIPWVGVGDGMDGHDEQD